jgi:hypothetical protein
MNFSLFPSSCPPEVFLLFNFPQPLPPIYLPPPTYIFISTYLPPSYLLPSYLPPFPIPIPTLSSLPSHRHHRQCALIPRSWCSYSSCSSLLLMMLLLLVLLMLFTLTPTTPHSCSKCSNFWCFSFSLLMLCS